MVKRIKSRDNDEVLAVPGALNVRRTNVPSSECRRRRDVRRASTAARSTASKTHRQARVVCGQRSLSIRHGTRRAWRATMAADRRRGYAVGHRGHGRRPWQPAGPTANRQRDGPARGACPRLKPNAMWHCRTSPPQCDENTVRGLTSFAPSLAAVSYHYPSDDDKIVWQIILSR